MTPINIHYRHILFDSDGKSITPLIPADDLPSNLFTVLPPNDRNLVMLREIAHASSASGPGPKRRWERESAAGNDPGRQPQLPLGTVEEDLGPSGVAGAGLQKKELGSRSSSTEGEPCAYFRRREGYRRGANCRFVHNITDAQKKQLVLAETWWRRNDDNGDDESPETAKVLT